MKLVHHEFHDLPNTDTRKLCWLDVREYQRPDGSIWRAPTAIYSSSALTGCDLPTEYEHRI